LIELTGGSLSLEQFAAVAAGGEHVVMTAAARERVAAARAVIERSVASGQAVYGVNTGFGNLANVRIADADLETLQERLVLSHAAGVGEPLPDPAVRGMLLLRANTLAKGHSGVRPLLIDKLLALLNHDLLPEVPSRGSVGASGRSRTSPCPCSAAAACGGPESPCRPPRRCATPVWRRCASLRGKDSDWSTARRR
jgi:histidine ammonia-lyase